MSLPAERLDRCAGPLRVTVTPARGWHIERMLPCIREADVRELWAGWRHTPEHALKFGLAHSSHVWTGMLDFEPICMVGIVPASMLCGTGTPWLIGTHGIERHQLAFLRRCKPHWRRMQGLYTQLANDVAADNEAAIRWLKWLGFSVHAPRPFGPDAALFSRFEWKPPDV